MRSRWIVGVSVMARSRFFAERHPVPIFFSQPLTWCEESGFSDFFKSVMKTQFESLIIVITMNILFTSTAAKRPLLSCAARVHSLSRNVFISCRH